MNNKMKPALLGGLIVGLLSAIPIVNYCCCIWGIGGGALAAYLYIKDSPVPVKAGDGAMIAPWRSVWRHLVPDRWHTHAFVSAAAMEQAFANQASPSTVGPILFIVAGIAGAIS